MRHYALLLLVVFAISCKSEPKEPSSVKNVQTENRSMEKDLVQGLCFLLTDKLDQKTFNYKCIPWIQKLYEENPDKYKMVHIIGSKLSKESNMQAYDLGYENLKNELNKLK
ncbi:hypothetical protein L0P88_17685 [Muricauda sp. SCSIO 64092]|uniref:hypothetical protein n=1 Tax=Allomuricauda sp. SCSIO 64092 TaxID=2908842 RepID=UPI001FF5BF13|nr:hypothetical protein [Muricauda sp. SCSIO 64092]UOY05763.1 hypothetical protein L0P88_17685 [Muricauda sp. SCSIO 64092]